MKILVRLPNWLGDMVMATAFVEGLHTFYPNSEIHAIIKKEISALAALIPHIHTIHPFSKKEFKGLAGVYHFGKNLKTENFDLFFTLPDSFSSALIGWASNSKKRIGFKKEGRSFLLTDTYQKPKALHRVDEYISLLEQFAKQALKTKTVALSVGRKNVSKNILLINFNSEAESRRMPVIKARQITITLLNKFPEIKIGFLGTPNETPFINTIISGLNNQERIINFAGKTTLVELTDLIADAKAVLSTDSGPAHLTNSIGTPLVIIFGAGNEFNTAPYNKNNLHIVRLGQLPCEPCVKNTCIFGSPKCLELLENQKLIEPLSLYLN
ncbi:MAG: lipopolysaccharide heptosyltransferase II [Sphingobacteriaceae bacterium]|nr:MAG: lipopolysaccharide heptosyltransferase II [Sphingobacteriaceae bacterium]